MQRNSKKVSICLIIAILVLQLYGLVEVSVTGVEAADYGISRPQIDENGISTWDCIYFGKYWQNDTNGDGISDENDEKEPIKWRVMSINGDDVFLLAENGLDCKQYNETYEDVTWENCTLRKWLNDTFLNTAFSLTEQEAIRTTEVFNGVSYLDTDRCGNNTSDKVFLLSVPEAINSSYGFWTNCTLTETRSCKPTEFAKQKGAWSKTGITSDAPFTTWNIGSGGWWLRTPGYRSKSAAAVMSDGYANIASDADKMVLGVYGVSTGNVTVRPAVHISLSGSVWEKGEMISACSRDCEGGCGNKAPDARIYDFTTDYTSKDGDKKSHTGEIRVKFDENGLANPSNQYNHNIATFCSILSTMAYDTSDGFEKLMDRMDYHYGDSYIDENGDSICYSLADKRVELDGEETDIVLAVMRGTYNMEWIDNFEPGTGKTHKGFQKGADVAYQALKRYIKKNHIGENGRKIKIIVTGHSRGAAVANLLGKEILDKGGSFLHNSNDLFDYSFATPNSTSLSERMDSKYDGIFSIVNPEDFVTKVLLSKNWKYGRYGKTKVLPSRSTDEESWYETYLSNMRTNFCNFRPYDYYEPYKDGMKSVSDYVNYVAKTVPSVNNYYNQYLGHSSPYLAPGCTLKNLYTGFLGYFKCNNEKYKRKSFIYIARAMKGDYGSLGQRTIPYFIVNQVLNPKFEHAHLSETYLAAMKTLDEDTLSKKRKIRHGIVNCPVDIEIRNDTGEVVGSIVNNKIVSDKEKDNISFSVIGDSKQFWVSGNEYYNVSLVGNATGTMDYILSEEDADSGETKRILYKTVPIQSDSVYSSEISGDESLSDIKLQDSEGKEVNISNELDGEELGDLSALVEIEGVGTANSYNNLSYGDSVVLTAVADQNNSFLGWYDSEDNIVSKEKEYPIIVTENQKYTAKFTNVIVRPESINIEEKLTMSLGEMECMEASVFPDNTTYSDVIYESNDENIVSVTGDGIIEAKKIGQATITVKSLMDESVQKKCEVVVQSSDQQFTPSPQPTKKAVQSTSVRRPSNKKNNLWSSGRSKNNLSKVKKPGKVTGLKVINQKKKKLVISWKWKVSMSGFQIQYAQNKSFTKKKKSKMVGKWTSQKTLTRLKKGRTYYVRVRAYKKSSGRKIYGKWSKIKKIKIRK